jgi:hypothetical protein
MKKKFHLGYVLVVLFLLTFIWWGAADAKETETIVEIGPSQVADNYSTGFILTITERFKDRYDITAGYISEQEVEFCGRQDCKWRLREQTFIGAQLGFTDPWDKGLRLGVGPYWFQNPDRVAPTSFRWGLLIEWQFSDSWSLSARHWSTAGSGREGCFYRDYEDPSSGEVCNDWNTGQDSWLRIGFRF